MEKRWSWLLIVPVVPAFPFWPFSPYARCHPIMMRRQLLNLKRLAETVTPA